MYDLFFDMREYLGLIITGRKDSDVDEYCKK